jgi:DNA replication protein DnaC
MRKHIRENFKESFKDAGLPLRHKDADMKDLTLPIEESQNCFFIGDKGLGKTYAMVAMAKALIKKGHRVRYITVPELMMELKSSFNSGSNTTEQAVLHRYSSIPYLFLDDIGVEKTSDYVLQALFIMIDRRYMDDLQICVSSNLSLGELSDHGDARLVSRLVEMCDVFEFSGKDRRIK